MPLEQVLAIHLSAPPGDILVFMTGQEDIETTCEVPRAVYAWMSRSSWRSRQVIAERMGKLEGAKPLLLLPMYSQLATDLQVSTLWRPP